MATEYFNEVKDFSRLSDSVCKTEIAISRLENPYGLDDEKILMYQDYLFNHAQKTAREFIDLNRLQMLPLLVKYRVIKKSNILKLTDYAREKKKNDILFYLMEAGHLLKTNSKALEIVRKHIPGKSLLPPAENLCDYSSAKPGQIVWMGKNFMPWLVLENNGKRLLLISCYVIDCLPFETFYYGLTDYITWGKSTIRYKLNTEYYHNLFTEEEKTKIVPVYISNDDSLSFERRDGITADRMFFLSVKETQRYLRAEKDRLAPITGFANRSMLWTLFDQYAHWWLRTDGELSADKYYVRDGVIMSENSTVSGGRFEHFGVRPAIYYDTK